MKASKVPEHYQFIMEVREAEALRDILSDVRAMKDDGKFGMGDLEDETAAQFIELVEEAGTLQT